jgi:toxin-antitoxin system PIN domain toxin
MTTYLLDANVLIALAFKEHEHHAIAANWYVRVAGVALCPMTEGALVRYAVSLGDAGDAAGRMVAAFSRSPRFEFWPDDVSYGDVAMRHVRGRNQVTDAYLLGLVGRHSGSRLATFDKPLAAINPSRATLLT